MIIKSQYTDPERLLQDEHYRGKARIFLGRENAAIDYGGRHVYNEGSGVGGGIERDTAEIETWKLHAVRRQCGILMQWKLRGICEN